MTWRLIEQYSFERAYSQYVTIRSQISIASKKRIESVTTRTWCQIVSLRRSVLCSQVQWLLHLDLAEQEQNLLNYIRSQFARFCTLYIDVCSRKRFARSMSSILLSDFRFLEFSIISRLSHFIDTSSESSTVKSHRYWVNEIATWDERFEISMKHRWRCRMNHNTNRQCTLVFIATLRSRVLASQCIFYSILDIRFHIDVSSHEKSYSECCTLQIFDQ